MTADFEATDNYSHITLSPRTVAGREWIKTNVSPSGRDANFSIQPYPGYFVNKILPELRAAGLTVDGDIDDHGRVKIRIRSLP